jgi:hypothetical protein
VAVQVAPRLKPVTVKLAGSDSEADVSSLAGVPEVQVMATVTLAALSSEKSLLTTTWAVRWVLVMVQEPLKRGAAQVPEEV